MGLIHRRAAALDDRGHPSYVDPPWRDRLAQRISQVGSGDEDGNEANTRRRALALQARARAYAAGPGHRLGECFDLLALGACGGPMGGGSWSARPADRRQEAE
jgi:hypothetical protein